MSKKTRFYQLNDEGISHMSEMERNILLSIVRIELQNHHIKSGSLDFNMFPEDRRELVAQVLKEMEEQEAQQ